jgi:hypothetical protein
MRQEKRGEDKKRKKKQNKGSRQNLRQKFKEQQNRHAFNAQCKLWVISATD